MKFSTANKGTYAAVKFDPETLDKIQEIQRKLNLFEPVPRDDLHSTICFSRVQVPYKPESEAKHIGQTGSFTVFKTQTGKRALVLRIESDYLHARHKYANDIGATYDFPDYQPHVTLAYDIGAIAQPPDIESFQVGITNEYVTDLDLDWKPKNN
jgi:2'-5' RNA ligase